MAPKISLLHITADSSLFEREHATQEFIAATDAVFFKAQGLVMLAPLHETPFSLLEGLLDNWHLLNLNSVEWPCKAEVHQACINLWSLNKQAPWSAEFGKMVLHLELSLQEQEEVHATALSLTQEPSQWSVPHNKGKGKAKVMEDDEEEEEATQKFRKELEDFVVLTTFDDKLLASLLPPPLEYYEGDIVRVTSGGCGSVTHPKGKSKENKSEDSLC
ncbi:hypothetical protein C0995_004464 [Termitomyces sp. Mi166|nr:hypothetical protein C0995_004464 [Termitomyces sp. Mi166\